MHQPVAYAMEGLQVELVVVLDRHEAHVLAGDCLSDRFRINEVVLVRLHEGLNELRRDQPHLVGIEACSGAHFIGFAMRPVRLVVLPTPVSSISIPSPSGGESSESRVRIAPAIFTAGDNDWTDCDRPSNGGYSSRERLDYERAVLFGTSSSLGQNQLQQEVQTDALCLGVSGPVPCVENRRWTYGGVTYATLNIQGSCNNLCDTAPDSAEWAARNQADIVWMQSTFAEANAKGCAAVMLITQADPGWDLSDGTRAPLRDPKTLAETDGQPDGFQSFLLALRDQVIAFRKPVAYVHGDSHYFRVDKPFQNALGQRLENFTRVETFGDNQGNGNNDVNWLMVTVSPRNREVFSYEPKIVPANRGAVSAP